MTLTYLDWLLPRPRQRRPASALALAPAFAVVGLVAVVSRERWCSSCWHLLQREYYRDATRRPQQPVTGTSPISTSRAACLVQPCVLRFNISIGMWLVPLSCLYVPIVRAAFSKFCIDYSVRIRYVSSSWQRAPDLYSPSFRP